MQHYNLHVRALTVPGPETDLSVFVAFDNVRYLFGCGEGTQRAFVQKRLRTPGLTGVFLPDGGSKGRAGLPGMIMTACDAGIRKLDIVGPSDTTQYVGTLRSSVLRNDMTIKTHAHSPSLSMNDMEEIYNGTNLSVRSVSLRPAESDLPAGTRRSATRMSSAQDLAEKHVGAMFHEGGPSNRPQLFALQPVPTPEQTATQMVYICQAPDVPGRFDNKKAVALGVPNGKIRQNLVRGEAIEFEDPQNPGQMKVVRPEEVVSNGTRGATMIMVNCSSETLPALLGSSAFDQFKPDSGEASKEVALMIHRVPTTVWQNPLYHDWIRSFGPNTKHLIATTDGYRHDAVFNSSAHNLLQLSLLDGDIFSPVFATTPSITGDHPLPPNTTMLVPNHQVKLQPQGELELLDPHERDVPYPTTVEETHALRRKFMEVMPEYAEACMMARSRSRRDPRNGQKTAVPGDDIVVTTLGTGSAIPSKYRNVSSTYLQIPETGGVLLDCGEGTLGQLRRKFGSDGMKKFYEDLKMIYVSHMHADHHLGLQSILEDRFKHGLTSKLYVIGPLPIAVSLSESGPWSYGVLQAALDNIAFIDTATLQYGALPKVGLQIPTEEAAAMDAASQNDEVPVASAFFDGSRRWPRLDIMSKDYKRAYALREISAIFEDLGLNGLRTPRVKHRGSAWGLVIQHPSGWKIVYSGDTTPCDSLIEAGQHATLLIHEATLEDDKPDVALEKGHSTFSQAIEVGIRMDAKRILLNHFSQRYPKLPKSKVTATSDSDPDVSISYDLMSIKVGEMWRMKHYMDAAELLFKEDDDGDVEDAVKHDVNATVEQNGMNGGGKKNGGKTSRAQKKTQKAKPPGAQAGAKRSASPTNVSGVKKPRSDEGEAAL